MPQGAGPPDLAAVADGDIPRGQGTVLFVIPLFRQFRISCRKDSALIPSVITQDDHPLQNKFNTDEKDAQGMEFSYYILVCETYQDICCTDVPLFSFLKAFPYQAQIDLLEI